MSDKTYICVACQATVTPDEARAKRYRCLQCKKGYLVGQNDELGFIQAVRPVSAPDPMPEAAPPEDEPFSLEAALRAALSTRHEIKAPLLSATAPESPAHEAEHSATDDHRLLDSISENTAMLVLPPPYNETDAAAMEQLAGTLSGLPSPIALEIAGEHGQRKLLLRGEPQAVKRIEHQLYRVYRQVGIEPVSQVADPAMAITNSRAVTRTAYLQPAEPEFLSLKAWREFEGNDPLSLLLGAFDGLQLGERALSQVIVRGAAPEGWAEPHLKQLVTLKRRGYGTDAPAPTRNIIGYAGGMVLCLISLILVMGAVGDWHRWLVAIPVLLVFGPAAMWLFSLSRNQWATILDEEATAKLREQAFQVELRLFAMAQTTERADEILNRLVAAYQLFNTTAGNRFRVVMPKEVVSPVVLSPVHSIKPALLSVKEIAGLWHMPVGESLELVARETYERLLPLSRHVTHRGGAHIGLACKGDQAIPVQLSPEALNRNLFVVGKTQQGKSTFMEHVATHWMHDPDRAVLIVDPHGDLARRAIGLVPPERVGDVIYIDLSDMTQSVGLNLLDVSDGSEPDDVAETFVDVGKALWQKYWGPRMLIPLGFGLRALAHANLKRPPERQYTILSLSTLLTCDADPRHRFLDQEVTRAARPDVYRYFTGEFAMSNDAQREQVISPVLSKAHAFERSSAIRLLVGQPRSTVQLFEAIRQRKIIILNTNSGVLGDDLAGFVGSLFLNVMRRVITRQTMLPRSERVQVSVIADEFQTMTGTDFGALLGELQKNGGNFVLGTQSLDSLRQMDETDALAGTIFAGIATLVALRVNGDDARYLVERELDVERLQSESLVNLPPHVAYVKTIDDHGRPIPVYSLEIAKPLAPSPSIVDRVQARRSAYTVSADEAARLVHIALTIFEDTYGQSELVAPPRGMGQESQRATAFMQQEQTPLVSEDISPSDSDIRGRYKRRQEAWVSGDIPDKPRDEVFRRFNTEATDGTPPASST